MCQCDNKTCPKCDPGIAAFYQKKIKEAKVSADAHNKTFGGTCHYEDFLDAKDIWYEYCQLRDQELAEENESVPDAAYDMKDSWTK